MTKSSSVSLLRKSHAGGLARRLSKLISPSPARLFQTVALSASMILGTLTTPFIHAADTALQDRYAMISDKAVTSLLLDIERLPDSERLVAVGDRGHILFSDDSGQNWQQARVPSIQMLTAVAFPTQKTGYAVGHDNLILKTEDAGENWKQVYRDIEVEAPLLDVWFHNEQRGMAVGAYGAILKTNDGGKNWVDVRDRIENEEEFHYNGIASDGGNGLYLVGEAGILYRSSDLGTTWETLAGPYEGSLFGVSANQSEVLIHGLRGNVYRSRNQGDSWLKLSSGTEDTLFGSMLYDDGNSYLVGNSGTVLSGLPGRWELSNRQDRLPLTALAEAPDGAIVVVGQGGVQRINEAVDMAFSNKLVQSEQMR